MFDFMLETGAAELTPALAVITVVAAVVLGFIISITYMKTVGKYGCSQGFVLTLLMIAPIIAIIVLLVGSNVARAFSLAGAFSIVRFRSEAGDAKDIAYIFFTLAAGLACGIGLVGYAFLFTLILCAVAVMVHLVKFGKAGSLQRQVRITVPEDLHYKDLFDEIFKKYTCRAQLEMMRTRELGSVFELIYMVTLLKDADEKDFIDEIRCRNGNLNITMLASMELPKK